MNEGEPRASVLGLALALIFFIASASVAAFLMAVFINRGLGVSPAALRADALVTAGMLGLLLIAAATTTRKD